MNNFETFKVKMNNFIKLYSDLKLLIDELEKDFQYQSSLKDKLKDQNISLQDNRRLVAREIEELKSEYLKKEKEMSAEISKRSAEASQLLIEAEIKNKEAEKRLDVVSKKQEEVTEKVAELDKLKKEYSAKVEKVKSLVTQI